MLVAGFLLAACGAGAPDHAAAPRGDDASTRPTTTSARVPASSQPSGSTLREPSSPPPSPQPTPSPAPSPSGAGIATLTKLAKCHGPIPDPVSTLLQRVVLCAWVVDAASGAAVTTGSLSVHLAAPSAFGEIGCESSLPAWVLDPSAPVPDDAALTVQDPAVAAIPTGTVVAYCSQEVGITNPAPYPTTVQADYLPGPGYASSSASKWTLPAADEL